MPEKRVFLPAVLIAILLIAGAAPAEEEGLDRLDFRRVVRAATEKVFPAVVYVKCIRETHEEGKTRSVQVGGSGVIIHPRGELLTNWHVVDKAVEIRCLLHDGTALHAKVVGSDKDTDLALLRLERPDDAPDLAFAALAESGTHREGDFVMAMGAPWGMARSVSIGIISCAARYLPGTSEYSLWIQTDASISPGNSGGPLVNTDGRVIGINTRAIAWGGDIGFSIPAATIRAVVDQFRKHGKVVWSWTGLQLQPLRDFEKDIYFEATHGVIVAGTDPESPARRAGLQPRDRILDVNGVATDALTAEGLPAVRRILGTLPLGEPARLRVARGDESLEITITPREKGEVEGKELDCPRWDFTVKDINRFDNPGLYFHRKKGVFVYGVRGPGNAAEAGLRRGDILLKIDSEKVTTLEEVERIHARSLENIAKKHRIVVMVLRNGLMRQVVLDFTRDYEKE